jgi:hypothetical protein
MDTDMDTDTDTDGDGSTVGGGGLGAAPASTYNLLQFITLLSLDIYAECRMDIVYTEFDSFIKGAVAFQRYICTIHSICRIM